MSERCTCRETLLAYFREQRVDVHVTDVPPLIPTPWTPVDMICPHGIAWYAEPTSEQQAQWAQDGVP